LLKVAPYNKGKKQIKKLNFVTLAPGTKIKIKGQIFQIVINPEWLD